MSSECELLVIGGSAGGFDVLMKALPRLNYKKPFATVLVLHRGSDVHSSLEVVLSGRNGIEVKEAEDKEEIVPNRIYLAPADYHLLIEKDKTFSLDHSEKMNFSRPSIDVTFETAAEAYQNKVTCVLLSGSNSDGAKGLQIVKKFGGTTAVQDPETCEIPYMPRQALRLGPVDHIVDGSRLGDFIAQLFPVKS